MRVDPEKCREVADIIANLKLLEDKFIDTELYPPPDDPVEDVLRFFFFVVAIDHRTRRKGLHYEEFVDGKMFRGSELLFRLSIIKYNSDREFFSPYNMCNMTTESVKEWLNYGKAIIWDPEIRAYLLRDCAIKILKLYNGSVSEMVKMSKNRLRYPTRDGLLDRLKVFRAYEDPVEKKSFLLVKFLIRRGLFTPIDLDNLHVAVDNHLMRVAIRTGILHLEDYEIPWFKRPVNYEEDIITRMYARKAYKLVAKISNINPMLLDDLIWSLGRSCCLYGEPICDSGQVPLLNSRGCPFRSICKAYSNRRLRMLNELEYLDTWYY